MHTIACTGIPHLSDTLSPAYFLSLSYRNPITLFQVVILRSNSFSVLNDDTVAIAPVTSGKNYLTTIR